MNTSLPVVLGLDPGARQVGLAIFNGDELIFYAVKSIKSEKDEESLIKLRKVLGKLLLEFKVEYTAVEKAASIQQKGTFVETVDREITGYLKEENIPSFK